jgi:hypothetical protein
MHGERALFGADKRRNCKPRTFRYFWGRVSASRSYALNGSTRERGVTHCAGAPSRRPAPAPPHTAVQRRGVNDTRPRRQVTRAHDALSRRIYIAASTIAASTIAASAAAGGLPSPRRFACARDTLPAAGERPALRHLRRRSGRAASAPGSFHAAPPPRPPNSVARGRASRPLICGAKAGGGIPTHLTAAPSSPTRAVSAPVSRPFVLFQFFRSLPVAQKCHGLAAHWRRAGPGRLLLRHGAWLIHSASRIMSHRALSHARLRAVRRARLAPRLLAATAPQARSIGARHSCASTTAAGGRLRSVRPHSRLDVAPPGRRRCRLARDISQSCDGLPSWTRPSPPTKVSRTSV